MLILIETSTAEKEVIHATGKGVLTMMLAREEVQ
jgi:hypothetical protein